MTRDEWVLRIIEAWGERQAEWDKPGLPAPDPMDLAIIAADAIVAEQARA